MAMKRVPTIKRLLDDNDLLTTVEKVAMLGLMSILASNGRVTVRDVRKLFKGRHRVCAIAESLISDKALEKELELQSIEGWIAHGLRNRLGKPDKFVKAMEGYVEQLKREQQEAEAQLRSTQFELHRGYLKRK